MYTIRGLKDIMYVLYTDYNTSNYDEFYLLVFG